MYAYPAVREALKRAKAVRIVVHMGAVGAQSSKPLELWGTAPWLNIVEAVIGAHEMPAKRICLATRDQNGGWTGNGEQMEASSEYSEEFAQVIAKIAKRHGPGSTVDVPNTTWHVKSKWAKEALKRLYLE